MIVLAIDPGFSNLGYAVGKREGRERELLEYGTLYFREKGTEARIYEIAHKLEALFEKWKPQLVVCEDFRVYEESYRGKHKTPLAIGVLGYLAYRYGAEFKLVNHNSWKAQVRRLYPFVFHKLSDKWKKGMNDEGSEHSRDAVQILFSELF